MDESDLAWLAGLLEGEGSFMKGPPSESNLPRMRVQMTDADVIERAAHLMGVSAVSVKAAQVGWKDSFVAQVKGAGAVSLMRLLQPRMGQRRRGQIDAALEGYNPDRGVKITGEQAEEIRQRHLSGETAIELAAEYGVTKWTVYAIRQGRR